MAQGGRSIRPISHSSRKQNGRFRGLRISFRAIPVWPRLSSPCCVFPKCHMVTYLRSPISLPESRGHSRSPVQVPSRVFPDPGFRPRLSRPALFYARIQLCAGVHSPGFRFMTGLRLPWRTSSRVHFTYRRFLAQNSCRDQPDRGSWCPLGF